MKEEKNVRLIVYVLLSLGILALVVLGVWMLNQLQDETGFLQNVRDNIMNGTGDSGSSVTETPSVDVASILFCKTAFDGLRSAAERTGAAGMLTMDRNSADPDGCRYNIRKMTSWGDLGVVKLNKNNSDGTYGITLEIESGQEEQLRLWGKAALFYFNSGIDEETAEEAVERVLTGEKADYDLFTISSRIGVNLDGATVTPMQIIEIRNVIDR